MKRKSASPFADDEAQKLIAHLAAGVGDLISESSLTINAVDLMPAAALNVTLYSSPMVLFNGSTDSEGTFSGSIELPESLEAGRHTVVVESSDGGGAVVVAGAFEIDTAGRIVAVAQPRAISQIVGPPDPLLERALEFERPPYDPKARPFTTASLIVSATALVTLAGAGGVGARGFSGNAQSGPKPESESGRSTSSRRSNSRGKLANVATKKLKALNGNGQRRGDASRTWRAPGTAVSDSLSVGGAAPLGKWTSIGPRIFVDGAWLRAMFGSLGFSTWVLGLVFGLIASIVGTSSPLVPTFGALLPIVIVGTLDAGAGAVAWLVMVISAVFGGDFAGWADVRTALGLGVLATATPLLAHVIRPLRRAVITSFDRTERVLDYVIMPVFVAFATASMLKALNGLSGLEIVSPTDVSVTRWVVGTAILVRLMCEDFAAFLYPKRMLDVQPSKLVSPGRALTGVSIFVRSLVFLVISEPFFGITSTTLAASMFLAAPKILKIWEDDLPNSSTLNRWLPRGHAQFFVLLVLGAWLTSMLLGTSPTPEDVKSSLIWILLPGVIVGIAELFGRQGGVWPNVTLKRSIGFFTWITAVAMVVGWFTPFS